MTQFETIPAATSAAPAPMIARPESKRPRAQASLARYAQKIASEEIASRHARDWQTDSQIYCGDIDSPLFANV